MPWRCAVSYPSPLLMANSARFCFTQDTRRPVSARPCCYYAILMPVLKLHCHFQRTKILTTKEQSHEWKWRWNVALLLATLRRNWTTTQHYAKQIIAPSLYTSRVSPFKQASFALAKVVGNALLQQEQTCLSQEQSIFAHASKTA